MDFKNHKDYQAIEATIAALELQLQEVNQIPLQDTTALQREINIHFQECINAILRRKADILNQLAHLSQQHENSLSKAKSELTESIELRKDALSAGVNAYHKRVNIAEQYWQIAFSMTLPVWNRAELQANLKVVLPMQLLDTINSHGDVIAQLPDVFGHDINKETSPNINLSDNQCDVKLLHNLDSAPTVTADNVSLLIDSNSFSASSASSVSFSSSLSTTLSSLISNFPVFSRTTFDKINTITTVAGRIKGFQDGAGSEAQFDTPTGIYFHPRNGNFYVCDNNGIRMITIEGSVTTFPNVKCVYGIAFHNKENSFYATQAEKVLKINHSGQITDTIGYSKFCFAYGIAIDQKYGNIFISDHMFHKIFIIYQGTMGVFAGAGRGFIDGEALQSQFDTPLGICFDEKEKNLLVCDYGNKQMRMVKSQKRFFTSRTTVSSICEMSHPRGITITSTNQILITTSSQMYQLVKQDGKYEARLLSEFNATSSTSEDTCSFTWANGIAFHEESNSCFIVETGSHKIRRVSFTT